MNNKEILSVQFFDTNGNDQEFVVGLGGVTEIERCEYAPEPFCEKNIH